jgi:SAM-dependent methyltransferase
MTAVEELDWYATPHWYDAIFDVDTAREADFLEGAVRRYGRSRGRRVLEPACGSGRLVAELARRGWRVQGSDLSDAMLAYARQRLAAAGLSARLERADMARVPARGRVDLAHCLVSTFKYLLTERAAQSHLRSVAAALAPGGLYCLGLHVSDYAVRKRTRERWVVERDGARIVCNTQGWPADPTTRLEKVRTRLSVEERGQLRRTETVWRFRTYDPGELRALIASVPALDHVATHTFHYDLDETVELDGDAFDVLLVLRRR